MLKTNLDSNTQTNYNLVFIVESILDTNNFYFIN